MDDKKSDQPKQKTPKGQEIPIPKRSDFLKSLKKVLKSSTTDRQEK